MYQVWSKFNEGCYGRTDGRTDGRKEGRKEGRKVKHQLQGDNHYVLYLKHYMQRKTSDGNTMEHLVEIQHSNNIL
jgi:hypothetical protein